jgi:hypothetical protein
VASSLIPAAFSWLVKILPSLHVEKIAFSFIACLRELYLKDEPEFSI